MAGCPVQTALVSTGQAHRAASCSHRAGLVVALIAALVAGEAGASDRSESGAAAAAQAGQLEDQKACQDGFWQADHIALSCSGGHGQKVMTLFPADSPQRMLYWQAPKGTQDLRMKARVHPLDDSAGATELKVKCVQSGRVLVAAIGGVLNQTVRSGPIGGAEWEWGGDPEEPRTSPFSAWLQIRGELDCDIEVLLTNRESSSLAADVQYSWKGISPCPQHIVGCEPCPENVCQDDEVARCDGSRYWECEPDDGSAAATHVKSTTRVSTTSSSTRTSANSTALASTATSTASTTTTPNTNPWVAAVNMRIKRFSFDKLSEEQRGEIEQVVVHDLARSYRVPVSAVKDKKGTSGHLTLSQGSVLMDGSMDMPMGSFPKGAQATTSEVESLVARSIAKLKGMENATVTGRNFTGEAHEVVFSIEELIDEDSSGGVSPWTVIVWIILIFLAVAAIAASVMFLLSKLKQIRSRRFDRLPNGDHAVAQSPERGISLDYANSVADEERQRLIPASDRHIPSSDRHIPSSDRNSNSSVRIHRSLSPNHKSNSSRRLGRGWPPGYEPLQREGA